MPTTTTTSVEQALGAAIRVVPIANLADEGRYGEQDFAIGLEIANLAPQPIVAWQSTLLVSVDDALGRTYRWNLLLSCTDRGLAVGESRRAGSLRGVTLDELDQLIAGLENCTIGSWEANPYIAEENGFWQAVSEGAAPRIEVLLRRVTFADGSGIGTAVTASR